MGGGGGGVKYDIFGQVVLHKLQEAEKGVVGVGWVCATVKAYFVTAHPPPPHFDFFALYPSY